MSPEKRYLITTGIFDDSIINDRIIFLGPWCLPGKEKNKFTNPIVAPSPWKPAIKIKEAACFCRCIYEQILPELTVQLNLLHEVSYPEKYWMVLAGPWLMHFINVLYERYTRLVNATTLFPNMDIHVLPKANCKICAIDTHDFASLNGKMAQDYYNFKLFSLITHFLFPEKALEKNLFTEPADLHIDRKNKLEKKVFFKIKDAKDVFCKPNTILTDMYYFDGVQMLSLELKSGLNGIIFRNFDSVNILNDDGIFSEKLRNRLIFKEKQNDFNTLLRHMIPMGIPICYIENFKKYKRKVKAESVENIGSAVGWYFNESFKFAAAESALKGSKLIDFQHGGGYGMYLSSPPEEISLEKNVFYTWGWGLKNNKKTIPLASPRLSRLKNTHKSTLNNLLLVGNNIHRYLCRFATIFTPDDVPQYFLDKKSFFYSLNETTRHHLLYRPYLEVGCREIDEIKQLIPEIRLMPDGDLTRWLQNVKIVVIDHLCTTNLEALVIDVPTVWYWDFNINLIRPDAQEFFEMLREVGILHNSPQEAANKVNEIFPDPLIWWRSPKVQKSKDRFCERFALTSKDWQKEWVKALNVHQ